MPLPVEQPRKSVPHCIEQHISLQSQGHRDDRISSPPLNLQTPSMSFRPYVKEICSLIDDVLTSKLSNSSPRKRARQVARHQPPLPYSPLLSSYSSPAQVALPPPPFPAGPGSSILTYSGQEGSLTVENHTLRRTGKKLTNRRPSRRTSLCAISYNDC